MLRNSIGFHGFQGINDIKDAFIFKSFSHFDVMECSYSDRIKQSYIACRPPGRAFVGLLLCLAITEFLVALIASVFTCIFSCCGGNNCCDGSQQGNELYTH